jgi:hypothetical protein
MSETKKLNYKSAELQKLYVAISPNIEVTEQGYVWWNSNSDLRDNAYPNRLIDLYQNASAVHSNFINLKSGLNFGSGLQPLDANDVSVKQFLDSPNRAGHTMNDIYKKMSADMSLFEASALQVIYNAEGRIAEVYHCSPANLRAAANNELGFSEFWYYSTRFGIVSNKRMRKPANLLGDAVKIANFNPANGKTDKRQILYIKKYSPNQEDYYPSPSYNSILNYVQLAFELAQFHLNKVQNSLSPSGIVSLKGNPADEEKDQFVRNFKMKHTGSDNAGKLLFMWSDGADQTPEFIRLEQDPNKGLYDELNDICNEAISIGHGGSTALLGIDKNNSIGNDSLKLNTARAYFINTIIEPMQEVMIDGWNKILKHNGLGQVKVITKPLALDGQANQADSNQTGSNNGTESTGLPVSASTVQLNNKLAGLSGKEFINLMRYVRSIKNGKMTKAAGEMMLKSSFGLDQETIDALIADEQEDDKLITEPVLN